MAIKHPKDENRRNGFIQSVHEIMADATSLTTPSHDLSAKVVNPTIPKDQKL